MHSRFDPPAISFGASGGPSAGREAVVKVCVADYDAGEEIAKHGHCAGQLLCAASGTMDVYADRHVWSLDAQRALWIPPECEHRVVMRTAVRLRALYIDAASAIVAPQCQAFSISDGLRSAIVRSIASAVDDDEARTLLFKELELSPPAAAHPRIVLPSDRRLRALCNAFIEDPGSTASVDAWAERIGMTRKALSLHFRREVGMTFSAWQRLVRVREAVIRLAAGESVTRVAFDLGYQSASAFTTMFRRVTGRAPTALVVRRS